MVAEERLYSLTEMAEALGLAEPTARRYRDAFEEFLPSVGVGRRRKFTEPAKQTLARIATLVHEQRMPVEVVRRILSSERTQAELNLTPAAAMPGDVSADLRDFSDSAALVANLDLVICVDTAAAHLAGALAKPVWVLLPWNAEWRWYNFGEQFYAYEGFRTHVFMTGLRVTR